NDNAAIIDWRRHDVIGEAGAFPKLSTGGQVIAADTFRCADNHLRLAFVLDNERSGPGSLFIASNLPECFTGALIERVNERVRFLIPGNDERIAVKHGGTSLTVRMKGMHPAKIF